MTTAKRKTATKPDHVKPLTSARWSGVKLSKKTEDKLKTAYAKRKTKKRSLSSLAKKSKPKTAVTLSKGTEDKLKASYARRRMDKRDSVQGNGTAYFKTADLIHIAEMSKKMAKRDVDEENRHIIDRMEVKTTIHDPDNLYIRFRVKNGPTGYVSIREPSKEGYTVGSSLLAKKGAGAKNLVNAKRVYSVTDIEIIISSLIKDMVLIEVEKKSRRTRSHRSDEEQRSKPHAKFVVGGIYKGPWDTKVQVVSRTPKTLVIRRLYSYRTEDRKCNIRMSDGTEYIYPEGSGYSMAPITYATELVKLASVPGAGDPDIGTFPVKAKLKKMRV